MTENKITMEKKKILFNRDMKKTKDRNVQSKKIKLKKRKRIIIRNLSFKISEDELKDMFSKFGEILDIKIPLKEDGKKRGFAFIEFKNTKSQIKAMKEMQFKKIYGRPIAIDFAINKSAYQSHQMNVPPVDSVKEYSSEDESNTGSEINIDTSVSDMCEDPGDSQVKEFLKEFDAGIEASSDGIKSDDENSDDADDQSESNDSIEEEADNTPSKNKATKKRHSEDTSEGKTVFIRNISYNITEEDLREVVEQYGDIQYCLFCMDPLTDQFKGSAFVKFKEKECADKLIQESSKEPGVIVDNRSLLCTYALSREELSNQNSTGKVKDKRNLNLLKCGMIAYGSKEAEGVSKTDMSKRAQLEMVKKQKLKNVNFFVSDKRLMIHNLPKNINDKDLYAMFKRAAGKEAVIKEARIMKDFKKTDAQGVPVSRGFGFVAFTEHEHALKALEELNNNPRIFTSNMRPIVEFSIENKVALLSQEKRKERIKMKRKRKLEEENSQSEEQKLSVYTKRKKVSNSPKTTNANNRHFQKTKQSKRGNPSPGGPQEQSSEIKQNKGNCLLSDENQKNSKNKQKKLSKGKSGKKAAKMNVQERSNLSNLANKYKEKLLNKYS